MATVFEIGSEYDLASNRRFTGENDLCNGMPEDRVRYFRSGRDSLRYLAQMQKDRRKRVLMPALCCSCMPEPFLNAGYEVVYYRLEQDYAVSVEDVLEKLQPHSVFLFMNYFGLPALKAGALEKIRNAKQDVLTVEDITHEFMTRQPDSFVADYTVCSIRKWLAIPDGGFLMSGKTIPELPIGCDERFACWRKKAMEIKSNYLETGDPEQKSAFREMLAQANDLIDTTKEIVGISSDSLPVLFGFDGKRAYGQRRENTRILTEALREVKKIRLLDAKSADSTLYFPILVHNRELFQRELARQGVYAPVIWPLPEAAVGICRIADETAEHMLAIPCDHRYDAKTVNRVADIVKEVAERI